jgi:ribosomal protein S18 acetylase RimI-like enzyme
VHGQAIIGYLSITAQNHLYHLFVHEAYQGRGIARKLWQTILAERTGRTITVRSSINAVVVYQRLGFVITGPQASKDGICYQVMEYCRR